jgi:hypothetical protein
VRYRGTGCFPYLMKIRRRTNFRVEVGAGTLTNRRLAFSAKSKYYKASEAKYHDSHYE